MTDELEGLADVRGDEDGDALRVLVIGLGGAKFTAEFYSRRRAREAVEQLMTCHAHHFAVVGEGHVVVMSHLAVECLRRAGMLPAGETAVYEGTGRGE